MPRLSSYLRPFRYDRVGRVALVETGPAHLIPGVLAELDRLFPRARVEVLLREEDAALAASLPAARVRVVRFEERADLVGELRREPFDLIVMQLSRGGALGLRSLPFVLRGNSLMAFNDSLDHFPVNVFRLRDLAFHFGLASQGVDAVLAPFLLLFLLASAAWIHVRGAWRRLGRARRVTEPASPGVEPAVTEPARPGVEPAVTEPGELDRSRAAAGSEGA